MCPELLQCSEFLSERFKRTFVVASDKRVASCIIKFHCFVSADSVNIIVISL